MCSTLLNAETKRNGPTAPWRLVVRALPLSAAGSWHQARGEWELVAAWPAPGGRAVSGDKTRAKASPADLGPLRGGANVRENPGTTDGGRNA